MISTLILVPTPLEMETIAACVSESARLADGVVRLCGFGPVAAAARSMQLMVGLRPQRVVLVGMAGALDTRLNIASAYRFSSVVCYGVGVGSADQFRSASELGWFQSESDEGPIADVLPISSDKASPVAARGQLLTCCAASDSDEDVRLRLQKFPDAVAEDMEGFSVVMAGKLAGIRVDVIRGISNRAGDRDKRNWKATEALESAAEQVLELIGQ